MSAHADSTSPIRAAGLPGHAARQAGRGVAAAVLVAVGIWVFVEQHVIRVFEAHLAATWFGVGLAGQVSASGDNVVFAWTRGPAVVLQITSECTMALLIGPLLLIAAAMLLLPRSRPRRLAVALPVSVVTVCVANQVRLLVIAIAVQHWGLSGYELTHKVIGSFVSIAGFVLGFLLMVRIAVSRSARDAG